MTHEQHVRAWLLDLAIRCKPRTEENIEVLVRDYAHSLNDLPETVFSAASREDASRKWQYFPPYRNLRRFLERWKPLPTTVANALPPPTDPALSEFDLQQIGSWHRLRPERIANGKIAIALDRYRQWPAAFDYLVRTDAEARSIAAGRGWLNINRRDDWNITPEWIAATLVALEPREDATPIGIATANGFLTFLRSAVETHTPEYLNLVPKTFGTRDQQLDQLAPTIAQAAATFEARHGRKVGQLSAEALALARRQTGIPIPGAR